MTTPRASPTPVSNGSIGVLALQGDFAAHAEALRRLGHQSFEVRDPTQLRDLDGLVIPGGESTTILRHFDRQPEWLRRLTDFARSGRLVFGTCAGLILLARSVQPHQPSLGVLDVTVERNGYGRQLDSSICRGSWTQAEPSNPDIEIVLIRAPRIVSTAAHVEVLAHLDDEPVLVRQNNIFGATFHPELAAGLDVYERVIALGMRLVPQTEA